MVLGEDSFFEVEEVREEDSFYFIGFEIGGFDFAEGFEEGWGEGEFEDLVNEPGVAAEFGEHEVVDEEEAFEGDEGFGEEIDRLK